MIISDQSKSCSRSPRFVASCLSFPQLLSQRPSNFLRWYSAGRKWLGPPGLPALPLEPELGVCYITGLGPILHKVISTRAERNQQNLPGSDPTIPTGAHYTLFYRQKLTDAEHVSSITEILYWIKNGPILQPPITTTSDSIHDIPVLSQATATPPHNIPAANTQQFETTQHDVSLDMEIPTRSTTSPVRSRCERNSSANR